MWVGVCLSRDQSRSAGGGYIFYTVVSFSDLLILLSYEGGRGPISVRRDAISVRRR